MSGPNAREHKNLRRCLDDLVDIGGAHAQELHKTNFCPRCTSPINFALFVCQCSSRGWFTKIIGLKSVATDLANAIAAEPNKHLARNKPLDNKHGEDSPTCPYARNVLEMQHVGGNRKNCQEKPSTTGMGRSRG